MEKILSKDWGNLTYFLAALFFILPLLMSFPHPAAFVAAFVFLAGWVTMVDRKKKAK
jgi:hypothetical protein